MFKSFCLSCKFKSLDFVSNSLEDPGTSEPEESRDEPNTFQESYDDINVDHLLNSFQLVGPFTSRLYQT